jgi:hypothetical protein
VVLTAVAVVAQNDCGSGRMVTAREAEDFARARNVRLLECSAKTKQNIPDIFATVARMVVQA